MDYAAYFFDLLIVSLPVLLIVGGAYWLLQTYWNGRYGLATMDMRTEGQKTVLPLRLQAYERLLLLCDRASIPNALLRVHLPNSSAQDLRGALMVTINQEFEHNVSQQLYVSETLWQILQVARVETLSLLSQAAEGLAADATGDAYVERVFSLLASQNPTPLQKAAQAVHTEARGLW